MPLLPPRKHKTVAKGYDFRWTPGVRYYETLHYIEHYTILFVPAKEIIPPQRDATGAVFFRLRQC